MSSRDEDFDYKSDNFCGNKGDIRPGLIKSHFQQYNHNKALNTEENNHIFNPSLKQRQTLSREDGLSKPLDCNTVGFKMVQKLGFEPGSGLGKSGKGRVDSIPVEVKTDRQGLGRSPQICWELDSKEVEKDDSPPQKARRLMVADSSPGWSRITEHTEDSNSHPKEAVCDLNVDDNPMPPKLSGAGKRRFTHTKKPKLSGAGRRRLSRMLQHGMDPAEAIIKAQKPWSNLDNPAPPKVKRLNRTQRKRARRMIECGMDPEEARIQAKKPCPSLARNSPSKKQFMSSTNEDVPLETLNVEVDLSAQIEALKTELSMIEKNIPSDSLDI